MKRFRPGDGFTIVELLIVIVIIGILSAVVIVTYNGIQRRGAEATVQNDLSNAVKAMEIAYVDNGTYPTTLPTTLKTSPKVSLSISSTSGQYTGLTPIQNAVLFRNTCSDMIAEGLGSGQNNGGATENYITNCTVYSGSVGNGWMQINGWTPKDLANPVTSSTLSNLANSITYNDSWRPQRQPVERNFMTTLDSRFLAKGGTYSIPRFWDPWASIWNGGVYEESLPPLTSGGGGWVVNNSTTQDYCIQATYQGYSDMIYHIRKNNSLALGACPSSP